MKILFIGDIMGRSGREALEKYLPALQAEHQPDITIVNGENAANGKGITEKICKQFYEWGVDVITTGNHVWDQREIIPYIARDPNLLRPINFPPGTPGNGSLKLTLNNGHKILIINAMGRLFMDNLDDPFRAVKTLLETQRLGQDVDAIFIDFHAETTSEKMSFGHYFDGQISAVIGTHTHIPTADAHIMENGTAYQTDAGMTGDYNSVIGVRKDIAIHRFVKKTPGEKMIPANGTATLCGAIIETNDNTGLATAITPIRKGGVIGGK
ncbi:MAG: TIGR00282 family metallophosphoesterase [Bdellovibrionales bacterium]